MGELYRAIFGLGMVISLGLSGWALKSVVTLLGAFSMLEERVKQNKENIKESENRLKHEIRDVESRQTSQYADLKTEMRSGFNDLKSTTTAIHKRIDQFERNTHE